MADTSHYVPASHHEHDVKAEKFRRGKYVMTVPPVCTIFWTTKDWIVWIDKHGKWED